MAQPATTSDLKQLAPICFGVTIRISRITNLASADSFNLAILPSGEGFIAAYRTGSPGSSIGFSMLDTHFNVIPDGAHCALLCDNEDPKLICNGGHYFGGDFLLMTCYAEAADSESVRIELRAMSLCKESNEFVEEEILGKFDYIYNFVGCRKKAERSWMAFQHSHDTAETTSLHMIYSVIPHRILEYKRENKTVALAYITDWRLPDWWQAEWGDELKGAAPPILLRDGQWLATWQTQPIGTGTYTGFYTFSAKAPFTPLAISPPILQPEHSTEPESGSPLANLGIVICGMIVNRRTITLSGGDNDRSCIVVSLDTDSVLATLRPIIPAIFRKVERPRAEIIGVNVQATRNIGDLACSPLNYFDLGRASRKDLLVNMNLCDQFVVIGGGSIFSPGYYEPRIRAIVESKPRAVVFWGVGTYLPGLFPDWLLGSNLPLPVLKGARNVVDPNDHEWVPCPSCMSPVFDVFRDRKPEYDIVAYGHFVDPTQVIDPPNGVPTMNNDCESMLEAVEFLSKGRLVITSTYHGWYWATLLNRPVVIIHNGDPHNTKFMGLPYRSPVIESSSWPKCVNAATESFPSALRACREANIQFYRLVTDFLREHI